MHTTHASSKFNVYWLLLAATLLAAWPQWVWMAHRSMDGSDDPWGGVALMTLLTLTYRANGEMRTPSLSALSTTLVCMVAATLTWGEWPPLLSSALAVLGCTYFITQLLPAHRSPAPLMVLSLLALPIVASLNFYLGYPLRWVCAHSTSAVLSWLGLEVNPIGATLHWHKTTILIDAPCAGIAMLWIGLYLAALFSYFNQATTFRTGLNLLWAGLLVVCANVLRNTLLFFKESGLLALPHWTHEAIGLCVFLVFVPCIFAACQAYAPAKERTSA